jgi:hypothetical protein
MENIITSQKLINQLLEKLNPRQKEIILSRFGFGIPKKTLEEIGKKYGVTRERVRQIESISLKLIKKTADQNVFFTDLINFFIKTLKNNGFILRTDKFLEKAKLLIPDLKENDLYFFVNLTEDIKFYEEDKNYFSFYYLSRANLKNIFDFIDQWIKFLKTKKQQVLAGDYHKLFENFIRSKKISEKIAANYTSISKKIKMNSYGDIGLAEWPEINPKVIRDKIYFVLKKQNKAMHFKEIAKGINNLNLNKKVISIPTVHNELIKDKRFVLIGRGIYALKEWGYEPGTARDVIIKLLKKEGPMRSHDIVLAIQKDRFFKQNTILANLQNKNYFERLSDGTYKVKEA